MKQDSHVTKTAHLSFHKCLKTGINFEFVVIGHITMQPDLPSSSSQTLWQICQQSFCSVYFQENRDLLYIKMTVAYWELFT